MERRNRSRILFVVCILVIGILAVAYPYIGWIVLRTDRYYVDPGIKGVDLTECSGKTFHYVLRPMNGRMPADCSCLGMSNSDVVYWSGQEKALCMISLQHRRPKWSKSPLKLDWKRCRIDRLSTDGHFAGVNVRRDEAVDSAYVVDMRTGKWKALDHALKCRMDPSGSGRMAMLLSDGRIVMRRLGSEGKDVLLARPRLALDWDYDFDSDRLYVVDGDYLYIISKTGTKRRHMPVPWFGYSVFWQKGSREVWVQAEGLYSWDKVHVFSANGWYLGMEKDWVIYPLVPSTYSETKHLLSALFQSYRGK